MLYWRRLHMMTWAYIAGFFDGEGSIVINRREKAGRFRIQIVQSEKNGGQAVLQEIQTFLADRGIRAPIYHASVNRKCPMFVLCVGQLRGIREFLLQTFPYLRVKRLHAQDVIRYATMFPSLRDVGIHTGCSIAPGPRPWVAEHMKGKKYAAIKLNESTAAQVRALKGKGIYQKDVAKKFGISRAMVEMIWLGKRWPQG
jgi:LAGLIDADG-like domain